MQHGSAHWQTALLLTAILFLLWQVRSGWRAGVVRSGIYAAGFLVSAFSAYSAAKIAAAPFGGLDTSSGLLAGVLVGAGLGFCLFAAIALLAVALFKRTEHQGSGMLRILWGAGGAFLGLLLGSAILWGAFSIVSGSGPFSRSDIANSPERPPSTQRRISDGLLALGKSLELGSTGNFLESVEALPPDFYELVPQIAEVTSNQEMMLRLLEYPGIRRVLQNPKVADLMNDPEVVRAAKEKNILQLFNSTAIHAALADPALVEQLNKIDLRAALKFALESPSRSPAPSQMSSPGKHK
jgi:hypothetical protein